MRAFSLVRCSREFAPLRRRHPRHPRSHPWIRHAELSHLALPRLLGRAPCLTRPSRTTATDSSRGGRGSGLAAQRHIAISARFLHCDIGRGALARLLACCLPLSLALLSRCSLVALSLLSKVPSTCCTHWRLGRQSSSVRRCCSFCWWSRHACCSSGCAIAACARPSRTFRPYVRERDTPHASRLARLSRVSNTMLHKEPHEMAVALVRWLA